MSCEQQQGGKKMKDNMKSYKNNKEKGGENLGRSGKGWE